MDTGGQAAPGYYNPGPPQYWQGPPPPGAALPPGSQGNGAMPWSGQYRPPLPYSQVANNVEVGDLSDSQKLNFIIAKMGTFENMVTHIQDLHNKLIVACEKIDVMQTQLVVSDQRATKAEYRLIDLEARSRRNNLIFSGIPEQPDENNDMCEQTLVKFIKDEMQLGEAADNLVFQRVHRLGRIRRGVASNGEPHKPRLIIAGFRDYKARDEVLGNAKKLKGKPFSVNQDFPSEIRAARGRLWPIYSDARAQGRNAFIAYPARLIIDGAVFRDEFPDWRYWLGSDFGNTRPNQPDRPVHNAPQQAASGGITVNLLPHGMSGAQLNSHVIPRAPAPNPPYPRMVENALLAAMHFPPPNGTQPGAAPPPLVPTPRLMPPTPPSQPPTTTTTTASPSPAARPDDDQTTTKQAQQSQQSEAPDKNE